MGVRYRCAGCGNLTRFDVVSSRRTRAYHHFSVGGDLSIEVQPGCAIDGSGNELILWDTVIKQVRTDGLKLPQTVYANSSKSYQRRKMLPNS